LWTAWPSPWFSDGLAAREAILASVAAPIPRFDIGRVIERTFGSLGRNLRVFLLLAVLLAGVPALLIAVLVTSAGVHMAGSPTAGAISLLTASGLVGLVRAIAGFVLQAAIVYGAVADLNGRRAEFAECLSSGLRNWFWLLLLAIVMAVAEVFGFLLLIVPGVIMAVAWIVAVPSQVVERTGVFGAMGRSAELTRGHRWAILGLVIIFLIASVVIQALVQGVLAAAAIGLSPSAGKTIGVIVAQPILTVVTSLIGAAGVASIYYELRSAREGIGPEALAAVFD
jgi:glycerophosphoryl diester phosphodiesterase family protein